MLFCLLMMGMTATVCHMLRHRKRPLPPKVVKIVFAAQCLGLLLCLLDQLGRQDGRVDRPQLGEGGYTEEWEVSGDDYRERVALEISEREPTGEEADALFSEAIEEIDRSFPGENKSLDCVTEKVNVQSAYADGLVEASWSFEPSGLVGSDGTLRWEEITENTLVQAEALLTLGERENRYCFTFQICLPEKDTPEGFSYYVNRAVRQAQEISLSEDSIVLPEETQGIALSWKRVSDRRGEQIALLGTAAGVALLLAGREEERRRERKRQQEKRRDYPEIVSSLSLFLGAGFSLRAALGRMGEQYLLRKRKYPGYRREGLEEILMTYREMEDGMGELEALRRFGERNPLREYRKLALLLEQNLRKGTRELLAMLDREELLAFELRQNLAKKAGEEASTRLLLPMIGLLGIVMAILLIPAMMTMNG